MKCIESEEDCRRLWLMCRVRENYGVTDLFDFRQKFNDFLGLKRKFITDSIDNPQIIIPLSEDIITGKNVWFGGDSIEDNYIFYVNGPQEEISSLLKDMEYTKVNESDLESFDSLPCPHRKRETGTKIRCPIRFDPLDFSGGGHWSKRNLLRVKKYIESHNPQWSWQNLDEVFLERIFQASSNFYKLQSKRSNFENEETKSKYRKILLGLSQGMSSYSVVVSCDSEEIAMIVVVYAKGVATVPVLVPCVGNLDLKAVNYIFRYCISHLPINIPNYIPECKAVDYQGGLHRWKTQTNPNIQVKQYQVSLNNILNE